jgi:hypothetical protein
LEDRRKGRATREAFRKPFHRCLQQFDLQPTLSSKNLSVWFGASCVSEEGLEPSDTKSSWPFLGEVVGFSPRWYSGDVANLLSILVLGTGRIQTHLLDQHFARRRTQPTMQWRIVHAYMYPLVNKHSYWKWPFIDIYSWFTH